MIAFDVQIVGGPFDGAPGLTWRDDGDHPPPEEIFLGRCKGDGSCGMARCRRPVHVAFWVEGLEDVPQGAVKYRKEDEYLSDTPGFGGLERLGIARYAYGQLDHFRSLGAEVEDGILSDTRERVLA